MKSIPLNASIRVEPGIKVQPGELVLTYKQRIIFNIDNYIEAYSYVLPYVINTVIVAVATVFLTLLFSSLSAYAFSRYNFFGKEEFSRVIPEGNEYSHLLDYTSPMTDENICIAINVRSDMGCGVAGEILFSMWGSKRTDDLDPDLNPIEIYTGKTWPLVLVFETSNTQAVQLVATPKKDEGSENEAGTYSKLNSKVVIDLIWAEWLNNKTLWKAAKEFLCDSAQAVVEAERKKAEKDFDEAIACSAVGKKIKNADKVIVVSGGEEDTQAHLFDGGQFQGENKILIGQKCSYRERRETSLSDLINYRWSVADNKSSLSIYIFAEFVLGKDNSPSICDMTTVKTKDTSIIIVREEFCPKPLPEGGKVIEL